MEFLQANWLWLLVGGGVVWLLRGRGGMGCGMAGDRAPGAHESGEPDDAQQSPRAHGTEGGRVQATRDRQAEAAAPRRHRGCE